MQQVTFEDRMLPQTIIEERDAIVCFLRKANADGTPCSAEREMLAQRIERGEHWR